MGTLKELSERTRVPRRTLYRWREKGIFSPAKVVNNNLVFYDLEKALELIRRYRSFIIDRFPGRAV